MFQQGIYYPGSTGGGTVSWGDVTGKPDAFVPAVESYAWASRPAASAAPGRVIRVTDVGQGGSLWYSDGTLWRPVSGALPLFDLSFGASGLAIGPSAGEVWVGPELLILAGTVRAGDILVSRVNWQESGTSDAGVRRPFIRTRATPGVTMSDPVLPTGSTSASSPQHVDFFKSMFVASPGFITAHWGIAPGTQGGASNLTLPGAGFGADLYLRPSFHNASATGTATLYHASLWLYRGGL